MASTASISGLGSGLDTASIIEQLMQLEAQPQTALKDRVTTQQTLVTTLQTLNTKAALIGSKSAALAKPETWTAVRATSSTSAVSVSTSATSQPTRFSATVTSVALTHQLGFAATAALTDAVTGSATTVRLDRFDGTPVELDTGDGTLGGLVRAINDPANSTGLHATAIQTGSGYRLLVESQATGAAQDFTLTADDGTALLGGASVRAGADASLDLGLGITATSSTNTFTNLVDGTTLTISPDAAVGTVATVTVSRDAAKLSSAVSDLVDSMNDLLSEIATQTSYDASTKTGGPLMGDSGVRNLQQRLLDSVYPTDGTSLAGLGIQVGRDGKLSFDSDAFAAAYAADPDGVAAKFTSTTTSTTTSTAGGFAARVNAVAVAASDPIDGSITSTINGRKTEITQMQNDVDNWDVRLQLRRTSLEQQYTALDTALNAMNSQSSWLTSQIAKLS